MATPHTKKGEKRQKRTSTEDLENSESPKKIKLRKELLEDMESARDIKSLSPRKKLSDIVNSSRVVKEVPKNIFGQLVLENPEPGSSQTVEEDNKLKEEKFSGEQNVTKPEPVKKRWLREACQDSINWEADFVRPIDWGENSDESYEIKLSYGSKDNYYDQDMSYNDSKCKVLTLKNDIQVSYPKIDSIYENDRVYTVQNRLQSDTVNLNEVVDSTTGSNMTLIADEVRVNNIRIKDEPISEAYSEIADDRYLELKNLPEACWTLPNYYNRKDNKEDDTSVKNVENSYYTYDAKTFMRAENVDSLVKDAPNLNETRPTVLMHSRRIKSVYSLDNYNANFQTQNFDKLPVQGDYIITGCEDEADSLGVSNFNINQKVNESEFSTALVLMELSKSQSTVHKYLNDYIE